MSKIKKKENNMLPAPPSKTAPSLRFSVCINNYNYEKFISTAIESCLKLNINLLKEIIIVDDGSTDNSKAIIQAYEQRYPNIINAIFQENQGQLSALKTGIKSATGDVICFLDADDYYLNDKYLDDLKNLYEEKNYIDMVFSELLRHKPDEKISNLPDAYPDIDYGTTKYLCTYKPQWIGRATSTISLKIDYARTIANIPDSFDIDWKIRADDVLVFGASVLGAHKYFFNKTQVGYLVHGNNNFYNNYKKYRGHQYKQKRFGDIKELVKYFSSISNSRIPAADEMYEESLKIPENKALLKLYAKLFLKKPNINIIYFIKTYIRYLRCPKMN